MEFPVRKPTRLKNYDYGKEGYYFMTICTHNRKNILSDIIVGEGFPLPKLTLQGGIAEKAILSVNKKYPHINPDKFVIMPNHIHIIFNVKNDGRGNPSPTVVNAVGWLKYNITKQINQIGGKMGDKIFQRSFYDHIIRDEEDYIRICQYIETNPQKWEEHKFYIE